MKTMPKWAGWVAATLATSTVPAGAAILNAQVVACGMPMPGQKVALVRPSEAAFVALADGVVVDSPYTAGDVVPAGNRLFGLTAMGIDNTVTELQNQIADLKLKLLAIRNISEVNSATLADYERRNGPLSEQARRRATRQDEIDILTSAIAKLADTRRQFEAMRRSADGKLPYPVLLLSDPPRVAETVKSGVALVRYAYLDRLTLSVFADANDVPAPVDVFAKLAGQCVRFQYLRTVAEQKTNRVELLYRASIKPLLFPAVAALVRSPANAVPLFTGPGAP